jgi:Transglutaminase-like superfamily
VDLLTLSEKTLVLRKPQSIFTRLARQTSAEWSDLLAAQKALVISQLLVWTRPVGRFVEDVQHISPGVQEPISRNSRTWRDALRTALALRIVADNGLIRPKCLVRAVALSRMLEQRGIAGSRVRIGVRRIDGVFSAHAWVELGQHVLGDDVRHVRSFAQLLDVSVVKKHEMKRALTA